ncbi:MAG: phosphonate ABC transporter, permease protein PhnE [Candidatus Bipolaricaulota bacterium]|nr:phosphonate ABC transporter, permease protein PhnE [Candidatus Bipolaricaulota bacterium]MDW8126603.1 phosphonate ABC transporter, permease protein PhnE [Candidatus Bipolaricaulota bacterium]
MNISSLLQETLVREGRSLRVRILTALLDLGVLGYLWAAVSISYGYFRFGRIQYSFFPWTTMLFVIVPAAALWSAWDQTLGLKIVNHELKGATASQRLLYALAWPLFPLTLFTALFDQKGRAPAELLSGHTLSEVPLVVYRPWYRTLTGWLVVLISLSTLSAAVAVTRVDPSRLVLGFKNTIKFWRAIFSPRWDLLGLGLRLLGETIFMAIMATAFAVPFAVILSFLAARNLMRGPLARPIYTVLRMVGSLTRSVDAIIWAIIFAVWVGTGSFAGVLALFVHSIVDLMKLYAEQLEAIDPGPVEALTATGANRLQIIRYAIIPQIINPYISFTIYRWDINVRMATVVGMVGGGGIGFRLAQYLLGWAFQEATILTLLIIIMVWFLDWTSARLREKLA